MSREEKYVLWFEEIGKEDLPLVGGKCANLGELTKAGVPVPPGFAVTSYAYKVFIEKTGIKDEIQRVLKEVIKDPSNPQQYREASKTIRKLIEESSIPDDLANSIRESYRKLCERLGSSKVSVAVRSSATAEDLPGASFAGQQETFLNVEGEDEVLEKVKKCWSSLFTPRAIFYRQDKGIPHDKVLMSVAIQKMVNAKAAGVMFTIHPVTGDETKIVIEGSWGLGEAVVSGSVTPDEYVVDKNTLQILEKRIAEKTFELVRDPATGKTIKVDVPPERRRKPCLDDDEARRLAELAVKIEQHYQYPQDIEWAIDKDLPFPDNVFIVQARPETVMSLKKGKPPSEEKAPVTIERRVIAKGLPASPGVWVGKAKVVRSVEEASKLIKKGDILVTVMTNPDWVPYMRLAGAIVTDEGGITCHAAIVSRELGIPAIVGTGNATKVMSTGKEYTVDATTGVVYEGIVEELAKPKEVEAVEVSRGPSAMEYVEPTGTKVYMNLGVPEKIAEYLNLPFDGIGLMRIEFIMTAHIGEHPLYLIEKGEQDKFVEKLAEGIATVARHIQPRPVVVRFSDFKTNEYKQLKGGERYEPEERNPMIGYRGVSRYISPQYEKAFRLECRAIRKVRDEWGLKNVWVMLPFVRTTWEVEKVLQIMKEEGLERGRDFKVWVMAEVPSVIFLADKFCKYIDGFSIGSNDLTQLILGVDRDSEILPKLDPRYFDERDPAVLRAISRLIRVAHKHGVTVSICGQGPSYFEDFVEWLVRQGIDSVSVNPDAVVRVRKVVAHVEKRILLEEAIKSRRKFTSR